MDYEIPQGDIKLCLCFRGEKSVLEGYIDSDMAGDVDKRRSISGYLFTFSRGTISWQFKLRKCVTLSTTETGYIAATEACRKMLLFMCFLKELGVKQDKHVIHCDSQSAIDLSKNATYHARTKHIDVRYHWIRGVLESHLVKIEKIHTTRNPLDMMTKVLTKDKRELCMDLVGMDVT